VVAKLSRVHSAAQIIVDCSAPFRKLRARQPEADDVVRAKRFYFSTACRIVTVNKFLARRSPTCSKLGPVEASIWTILSPHRQEAHQNVAQFVRLWMKHLACPRLRVRYENSAASLTSDTAKEHP